MGALRARRDRSLAPMITDGPSSARAAGLRYSTDARPGHQPAARGPRLQLSRRGRHGDPRRGRPRPDPRAGHPARLDRRLDLPGSGRPPPGDRARRPRTEAVSLSRPLASRAATTSKFERLLDFAAALPRIRRRCDADLARPGLPREKVLAAVVRLLETTLIRVGNDEYARLNRSFGLTTMRGRHVRVEGTSIRFRFRGKSGPAPRGRAARPSPGQRSSGAARSCPARSCSQYVGPRRRGPRRRVRRRQRLPARDLGGGRDGQGLPDLGGDRARLPRAARALAPPRMPGTRSATWSRRSSRRRGSSATRRPSPAGRTSTRPSSTRTSTDRSAAPCSRRQRRESARRRPPTGRKSSRSSRSCDDTSPARRSRRPQRRR